jgi:hypothetical protein
MKEYPTSMKEKKKKKTRLANGGSQKVPDPFVSKKKKITYI